MTKIFSLVFVFFIFEITSSTNQTTSSNPYKLRKEIVNAHNFSYTLNPGFQICGKLHSEEVFVLIYVHTSPKNYKRRLSIRETWARRSMFRDIRLVFMMGKTEDKSINETIQLESNIYGDIVQEDFVDSYKNLTYKGIMAMRWISAYCKQTKYILKVDDDIITNTFILLRHLKSLEKYENFSKKSVMCLVWTAMKVQREKNSKWYIPKEIYEPDTYSPYCSGSAYIFSGDLPSLMYKTSQYLKFMWVDDFYITGLLADAVNATHRSFNSLYIVNSGLVESTFQGRHSDHTVFGHIPNSINKMHKLWKFIFENQLVHHPSLGSFNAYLFKKNDFTHLREFSWSSDIWKPYLDINSKNQASKHIFEYDNF